MTLSKLPFAVLATFATLHFVPTAHGQSVSYLLRHSFTGASSDGSGPGSTTLARGTDGNLYGTATGGVSSGGTVFKLTPAGVLTKLYDFGVIGSGGADTDGQHPVAGVIQGSDGNFYGTTQDGGTQNSGTIFKLTPAGALTTLHHFDAQESSGFNHDGAVCASPLIQGKDGNFYGTASEGGAFDNGTIFKITPAGVFTLLHTFSDDPSDADYHNDDGASPVAGLVQGGDGNFYGATPYAGMFGFGTLFKVTPAGVFTTLYHFNGPTGSVNNGAGPAGTLALGRDGALYGTAQSGGLVGNSVTQTGSGTVFKITPDGVFTLLHRFDAADGNFVNHEGAVPVGGLILGSDGNFYGACEFGGANGRGTVFKLTPDGAFTLLHTFSSTVGGNNTDGARPLAGLTQGAAGHYYGTASLGGAPQDGTIYEVTFTPVITSAKKATAKTGAAFSYQIVANHNPTSYGVAGLPAGLHVDARTGLISGTPTGTGTKTLTLKATNAYGVGQETLTLTITPPAPVITSAETATGMVNKPFSYQIVATNQPTSFGVAGLPKWLTLDAKAGLLSGTPTGKGTFSLTLRATNASGSDTSPLKITVQ